VTTSEKYKNDPVVFVAVNSGNDPKVVEGYLKGVNVPWRALADVDRSYEKAANVGVISTKNIWQQRMITADGQLVIANDADATIQAHLTKAKWKVDPTTVPESMKPLWKAVEFGDYTMASSAVKRSLASKDEKTKTAAEAMQKAMTDDLEALVAEAAEHEKAGRKWDAYKLYDQASDNFKGYPKATEAAAAAKKLATDKELKDEIKAWSILAKAKKMLGSRNRAEQRSGESMIESLAKSLPDTEAGQVAAGMGKATAE